ncbi:MAG: bifunctional metallophosphatase/5'-nucleotidase [Syntrophales bacterium]|jgi:2',3'-cyclic-nucleotide 2'-phosphodiesterase (5'-nucleotidase family)|nr:bifunctional metallophosphatase/5'-nucleotidase [Syntrophales bacterium]MCK9527563.1 bifunctional metallophosphatase/5'-nucleotidase [Syntrophales bacterium]MDX9922620.1 bifunctional UDP-sugar hydrolase/5'-nucleotidase [Syntrophales bacterium]
MKRSHGLLRIFLAAFLVVAAAATPSRALGEKRNLVILFTHDLHSHFLPQRHEQPDGSFVPAGGHARLATLIRDHRERHGEAVLLLDAGDYSMGTLFHTAFMTEAFELTLMAEMGYDAVTIGNHEYDFKPDGLARSLAAARKHRADPPALVASNVVFTPDDPRDSALKEEFQAYPVKEYLVIEKAGIRTGIFGILGKNAQVDAPFAPPVTFSDPVEQSRKMVEILRNREGVDLVICLSHTGTGPVKKYSEDERLAEAVPGIDVIVSGHTHTLLMEPIVTGTTCIVSAGQYGAWLGVLEMDVPRDAKPRVLSYRVEPVKGDIPEDGEIAGRIREFKKHIDNRFLEPLGLHFDQPVAMSGFSTETLSYMSEFPGETGLGNLITDAYRFAVKEAGGAKYEEAHVAIQPLGHIRDSLREGPVTVADIFRILALGIGPDGNPGYPLITGYLTGRELKKLMEVETTVSSMKRDAHLSVSGLQCAYNPHRLPFDRVTSIMIRDEGGSWLPVDKNRLYRVTANLYTAHMVDYISHVSKGLLSLELKGRDGKPLRRMSDGIVTMAGPDGKAQELKEWLALISYMKSFPDSTGDGIPDIPVRYASTESRITVDPSLHPLDLVRGGTMITWAVSALALLILTAPVVLLKLLRRRRRSRKLRFY